ncbi:MAG: hypothetical protein MUF75_05040 [Bacteroidia bacterium]|jgi:hypothetical protein|nr:hypothetical protein [Bacteroidia bacterium]
MNSKQVLLGTLLGGVSFFFLGWLIFGILIEPLMRENCNTSINLPMEEMRFGPLILSNLIWGALLTLVLHWNQQKGLMGGLKTGAFIGLLVSAAMDLSLHSMTTYYHSLKGVALDVMANTLMYALVGAVLGLFIFKPAK